MSAYLLAFVVGSFLLGQQAGWKLCELRIGLRALGPSSRKRE